MDRAIKHTYIGLWWGLVATALSVTVALWMGWIEEVNFLELFAVATSYTCTYLCVMQVRWQYIFAAVTTVAYTILFWQWGLYGSALASAYIPIALLYGWYRWGRDANTRSVSTTPIVHYPLYVGIGLVGWAGTYYLAQVLGITVPVMDSAILVLTIMAQFMMDNKKLENWFVWLVLNVIAIGLYWQTGLYLAAFQYVFFLGNTIFGLIMWYRSMGVIKTPYYANTGVGL